MVTVGNIYDFINEIAPFEKQESYDNSGLCVGNFERKAEKILISLDCTAEVAREARETGADLVVTHHPVIFKPIKRIDFSSPEGILAAGEISLIAAHTSFDLAVMNNILCEKLGLTPEDSISEGFGCVCGTEGISCEDMALRIKTVLGCKAVRFNRVDRRLKRIAVCSGSGGSFLADVAAKGCDGFITGDVKHDVFISAANAGICVFDGGHYNTENIFCEYMKEKLEEKFEGTEVVIAKSGRDILETLC